MTLHWIDRTMAYIFLKQYSVFQFRNFNKSNSMLNSVSDENGKPTVIYRSNQMWMCIWSFRFRSKWLVAVYSIMFIMAIMLRWPNNWASVCLAIRVWHRRRRVHRMKVAPITALIIPMVSSSLLLCSDYFIIHSSERRRPSRTNQFSFGWNQRNCNQIDCTHQHQRRAPALATQSSNHLERTILQQKNREWSTESIGRRVKPFRCSRM